MVPEGRDEVRQRIDFLYEQAENATGNYNATRAMSAAGRNRGVALSKGSGRRTEPDLDAVARQWFDAARAKIGPTLPAVLPADRTPEPPGGTGRPWGRANGGDRDALSVALPELAPGSATRASDHVVAELTAGPSAAPNGSPRAALEAGTSGSPGAHPELPAARPAELPAARPAELPSAPAGFSDADPLRSAAWGTGQPALPDLAGFAALPGLPEPGFAGPAETAVPPVAALPAPQAAPTPMPRELPVPGVAPRRRSPADSKASHRRKLEAARDLLIRQAARLTSSAVEFQPATGQWEQPLWTAPATAGTPHPAAPALTPDVPDPLAGATGSSTRPVADALTNTGAFTQPALTDTGSFTPSPAALTDTGSFTPSPAAFTTDTGSPTPLPQPAVTDTGSRTTIPASFTTDTARATKAIAFARAQVGKPCVWGATGPESYDCSSLTRAAWRSAGVTLPRAAHEQARAGTPVPLAGLEPGDLVLFFDDDRHVGLHIGDGMMVHAPGPGSTIREESIYGAGESAIHRVVRPA
ncbi:NlpC/P60 family protein [Streptomyces sp. NPDC059168]|uniref:NlpC/P60 family protein n=1 Tax=Streptomyces sp. NPDC059168 TaxID=3346753 RepID=UPI00369CD9CD